MEFAVVLVAFLAVALALMALWKGLAQGGLGELIEGSLSHAFGEGDAVGFLADLLSV